MVHVLLSNIEEYIAAAQSEDVPALVLLCQSQQHLRRTCVLFLQDICQKQQQQHQQIGGTWIPQLKRPEAAATYAPVLGSLVMIIPAGNSNAALHWCNLHTQQGYCFMEGHGRCSSTRRGQVVLLDETLQIAAGKVGGAASGGGGGVLFLGGSEANAATDLIVP
jgi:hypothetical protein